MKTKIKIELTKREAELLCKYDYKILDDLSSCGLCDDKQENLYKVFTNFFIKLKKEINKK